MKDLIEDYKRRLATITEVIDGFKSNGSINDISKDARLKTKQSEYRTIIAELERTNRRMISELTHVDYEDLTKTEKRILSLLK